MDASLSLVISIVALASSWGWGWYKWRRTGDDLKVAGDLRAPLFQSAHTRRVRAGVSTLGGLTVVAVNRGRTSTEIHKMWLVDTNGRRTSCSLGERSAPLPVTVGARNRVYWYVDARTLGVMTKQGGNPLVVRPVMESGPGTLTRRRKMCIAVADEHLPGAGQRFTPTLAYRARTLRKGTKDLQSRVRAGEVGQVHFEAMPLTITTEQPEEKGTREHELALRPSVSTATLACADPRSDRRGFRRVCAQLAESGPVTSINPDEGDSFASGQPRPEKPIRNDTDETLWVELRDMGGASLVLDEVVGDVVYVRQPDPGDDTSQRIHLEPGQVAVVESPVAAIGLHPTDQVGANDMVFSLRVVPERREPVVVFARTLRRDEPDDGRRVHVRPGEQLTLAPGSVSLRLGDPLEGDVRRAICAVGPVDRDVRPASTVRTSRVAEELLPEWGQLIGVRAVW